ncbi:hypothetical protein QBC46DRAFT_441500 [Diplogelasinospora grovesii]|uniref:ubiquitinyl hydrolase 1 n=1 Tax=Diplogelasinospora grovesii TaxID=303347 RepID=A0AAN6N5I6_9PEZI|nr:hypothetical protein QBC46DRAFT_441500 [Diplogelasinospora grovesii]
MDLLASLYYHLVVPPIVPGSGVDETGKITQNLLTRLVRACRVLGQAGNAEVVDVCDRVAQSLTLCAQLNNGRLEKASLLGAFHTLETEFIILHVVEQNAGLIIRREIRDGVDTVIFESFEASPPTQDVLEAEGALQWDFPGRCSQIPYCEFTNSSFQSCLATFLEKGSAESLSRFAARSTKAGVDVIETRNTSDCALISQMLMSLLEAIGSHADTPRFRKRVRDDVNIGNEKIPWRRAPIWLILRVATRRQFCLELGDEVGVICYKYMVCALLTEFLDECTGKLPPEMAITLKAKLCRRLAKLETEKQQASGAAQKTLEGFLTTLGPWFETSIRSSTDQLHSAWNAYKSAITRGIPALPHRAPQTSTVLSLPNSGKHLDGLLSSAWQPQSRKTSVTSLANLKDGAITQVTTFANRCFQQVDLEARVLSNVKQNPVAVPGMSDENGQYWCIEHSKSINSYFDALSDPYIQNPGQMSIFILNILEVWVSMDQCAVKACPLLRDYHPVFTPYALDALHLPLPSDMRRLVRIQSYLQERCTKCQPKRGSIFDEAGTQAFAVNYVDESDDRDRLRRLWEKIRNASERSRDEKEREWEAKDDEFDSLSEKIAEGTCVCSRNPDGTRNVYGCEKCYNFRVRRRLTIATHEDYLPEDRNAAAAIVFELGIPTYLAAYRDATWKIFSRVGHPSRPSSSEKPALQLQDHPNLKQFMGKAQRGISLASLKKPFLNTHYKLFKMEIELEDILLPFGCDFSYYDMALGIWSKELDKPLTFQHLCGVHIPTGLQGTVIQKTNHPPATVDGPSSYTTIASQTKCPSSMSVHEFMAYQRLLTGESRRWFTMLVELGSSNLNFSTEDTMQLFNHLAVQAGSLKRSDATNHLREVHSVFRDDDFCTRLAEQIEKQKNCMDVLITLSLRLSHLASGNRRRSARQSLLGWISILQQAAGYGVWAALLWQDAMSGTDLTAFVEASVALQESLTLQRMLVQDMQTAYRLRSSHPQRLSDGISKAWPDCDGSGARTFSTWQILPAPHDRWATATISSAHYNFIEGHLLIDGKPLRDSADHLLASPVAWKNGQEIHLGLRGKEFIPGRVFKGSSGPDLPADLIENCSRVEIRRNQGELVSWETRMSDWVLDLNGRQAWRRQSILVDPHSKLAKRIHKIFEGFESSDYMTIYQAKSGPFRVEMKRLDLTFAVNGNGCLESRELRAEVDPNQDAGTLYGFESKIVIRDTANFLQRSIITALGELTYKRQGQHVRVFAKQTGKYAKFQIDDVLGRLKSAPEPHLLYSKALFHAATSFPIPDPLTNRTGTEEALYTLASGACQPWQPLAENAESILKSLASLCPGREYYPPDKRTLQRVRWDPQLTTTIQHDALEDAVQDILNKSSRLSVLSPPYAEPVELEITHLRRRGVAQRLVYERAYPGSEELPPRQDKLYGGIPKPAVGVYQIVRLLRLQSQQVAMKSDLASILRGWEVIGGFQNSSDWHSNSLRDLVDGSIGEQWGNLVNLCISATPSDMCQVIFRLGLLAFSARPNSDAIRALAAFACIVNLKTPPLLAKPPPSPFLSGSNTGTAPTIEVLEGFIAVGSTSIGPRAAGVNKQQWKEAKHEHQKACRAEVEKLAELLVRQWPCPKPFAYSFEIESEYLELEVAMEAVLPLWQRQYDHSKLWKWVSWAQGILDQHQGFLDVGEPRSLDFGATSQLDLPRGSVIPSLSVDLLRKDADDFSPTHSALPLARIEPSMNPALQQLGKANDGGEEAVVTKEMNQLQGILNDFPKASNQTGIRRQFTEDLKESLEALKVTRDQTPAPKEQPSLESIWGDILQARAQISSQLTRIREALQKDDQRFRWFAIGNLWPCMSSVSILELLRSTADYAFGKNMKESLVAFGLQLTHLQRLLRIRHSLLRKDGRKLKEEMENEGHANWNPSEYPDWLLLELDADLLIRDEQAEVAEATISPASGSNSVLQMNMGKGKTSCIVPMVMAVLAKRNLARLIVPKALLLQSAQVMQSRLGGLVGREVRRIPFSRRTPVNAHTLGMYEAQHMELYTVAGCLLSTPEFILSYKLSGLQQLVNCEFDVATKMMGLQSMLTNSCRDVLDESDFTLAVKTQLIYPSGPQLPLDGHPQRWEHIDSLRQKFGKAIDVLRRRQGAFPMVHFLKKSAEDALHSRIVDDISNGRTPIVRLSDSDLVKAKDHIKCVLTDDTPDWESIKRITDMLPDGSIAYKKLLLVRGLLANRILLLCLKKRHNVQYGLHPTRDPMAVPFEAKGVPSEQAEFGHPDVAILFTCLAFYYTGLNLSQFGDSLGHVLKSDDPAAEYDRWTHECDTLPEEFCHWNLINVDDKAQLERLWQHLRFNRSVLDHYMNTFVFPVHAKQFGVKLQASGWDLPLIIPVYGDEEGEDEEDEGPEYRDLGRSTGFSGTNDNKALLPLTIKQNDLPSLAQTNAEVLTYLLQPRNRQYRVIQKADGRRKSETEFLRDLRAEGIRVLIDAGAFIQEMANDTLAQTWLSIDTEAKAAVYFDNQNRAWVKHRGRKEALTLLSTPFAENLDECLVYLDEAHTRGTDLKLPPTAKGAVTLALGQTKDHTVQAAMRLRQLGTTQSVVFFAPPEVNQSVADVCNIDPKRASGSSRIDSAAVVRWLLEMSCQANENLHGLYLAQGADFCRRTNPEWENPDFLCYPEEKAEVLDAIVHPERQTLEQLYGPAVDDRKPLTSDISRPELKKFAEQLAEQARDAATYGSMATSALEEVEQEREVEFQVERVRQVQKPEHRKPLNFPGSLHPMILRFVETGRLALPKGFFHAFTALGSTNLGKKFGVKGTSSRLYVSAEFVRTIELGKRGWDDDYLRGTEWVLYAPSTQTALVIIPEEAELVIPRLRDPKNAARVHLIPYAAPVTKNMLPFSRLSYYALPPLPTGTEIPEWLTIELGILGGRLYFEYEEYAGLCWYLGLETPEGYFFGDEERTPLSLSFLLEWLTLRRKGQSVLHTPMGYICLRKQLREDHPFFTSRPSSSGQKSDGQGSGQQGEEEEEQHEILVGEDEEEDYDPDEDWSPSDEKGQVDSAYEADDEKGLVDGKDEEESDTDGDGEEVGSGDTTEVEDEEEAEGEGEKEGSPDEDSASPDLEEPEEPEEPEPELALAYRLQKVKLDEKLEELEKLE